MRFSLHTVREGFLCVKNLSSYYSLLLDQLRRAETLYMHTSCALADTVLGETGKRRPLWRSSPLRSVPAAHHGDRGARQPGKCLPDDKQSNQRRTAMQDTWLMLLEQPPPSPPGSSRMYSSCGDGHCRDSRQVAEPEGRGVRVRRDVADGCSALLWFTKQLPPQRSHLPSPAPTPPPHLSARQPPRGHAALAVSLTLV